MDYFHYRKGELYCEDIKVADIVKKYSTPLFIYSLKTLVRHFHVTSEAFGSIPHIICYAAKANPNLAILKVASLCDSGADVVSEGELRAALKAGIPANKIVFSGVGKTDSEIEFAARTGILFICAESLQEIDTIGKIAKKLKTKIPVAIRVNPEIDPKTHPYIATGLRNTKFGLSEDLAKEAYKRCRKFEWVEPVGISMHIGSQVETVKPYVDATKKIVKLYKYLWKQNIRLRYIDIGGGWAAHFNSRKRLPHPDDYISAVKDLFADLPITVVVEPGRSLIGNAGILVMSVLASKKTPSKNFCIVDAGMNDFIRPPLYGARHRVEPVKYSHRISILQDVVGPVCESSDFFAKKIKLPLMKKNELLALFTAGAYGSSMSSNYNSRRKAAEVAVAKNKVFLIKKRETYDNLIRNQNFAGIDLKLVGKLL